MSRDVIHRYEKNTNDFEVIHAETDHLQKMSLSDPPQEQNKKRNVVGSGSNEFQTRSPGAYSCVDNDFVGLMSTQEAKGLMKRQREWNALHTCTRCGFFDHKCLCKVRAPRWRHWNGPSEFKKILGKDGIHEDNNALPPWLAKRRQEVLEETKDLDLSLFWSSIQKK
ncbi:hypothetical protein CTI12_AA009260 [Artemisia annua]|uniref:Uncharacterized protein n=1 Tax=Artemisia annua TaxID=35608 RepID=A0A2U1QN01_ARTAN|nr:hypothetical protein CTI12_AA009260 [Artemisia annua]